MVGGKREGRSALDQGFEFYLAIDGLNHILDVAAILLGLQVLRFFADEFLEAIGRKLAGLFPSTSLGLQKCLVQLVDFFSLALGLGTYHPKSAGLGRK